MPTIEEFGQSIKKKYPQYQNVDDKELGTKFLQKYPEYQDRVFDTDPNNQAAITQPKKTAGILDAFVKGARNVKDSIVQSGNDVADIQAGNLSTGGKILGTFGKFLKPFAQIGAEAVATPLRVGGEIVEDVTGKDVNEGASKAIQALIGKGMKTEQAQKLVKSYEELKKTNPEAANALQATFDITDFATIGAGGAKVGTAGFRAAAPVVAKSVGKVAEKAGDTATSFAGKVGKTTGVSNVPLSEAVSNIKKRLLSQIEGKSSSLKKLDKTRSDILETIASNKKYHPDIDPENKTFNVGKAVQNMDADISAYSEELGGLFRKVDEMDGGVPTDSIVGDIMSKLLTPKNTPKFIVGGKSFMDDIQGLVERMRTTYGDRIPREAIWDIRKQIDQSVEQLSDTNVKKSLRQDIRKAFASSLEKSIAGGESDLVKRGMAEIGKIIEARDYTRDVLQGFKIQGGKLTDIIRNAFSGNVGQAVGAGVGGAFGNIPGAVIGYGVSSKLGQWLAKNALTNAADRKALVNLVKERPAVFDEIKQYIEGLSGKEKTKANEGVKLIEQTVLESPKLPEGTPGTIQGATIRLPQKSESPKLKEFINRVKSKKKDESLSERMKKAAGIYDVKGTKTNPEYSSPVKISMKQLIPSEHDKFSDVKKMKGSSETVKLYKEKIKNGEEISPALAIKHIEKNGETWYEVSDGHHKIQAAKELGVMKFPVQIVRTISDRTKKNVFKATVYRGFVTGTGDESIGGFYTTEKNRAELYQLFKEKKTGKVGGVKQEEITLNKPLRVKEEHIDVFEEYQDKIPELKNVLKKIYDDESGTVTDKEIVHGEKLLQQYARKKGYDGIVFGDGSIIIKIRKKVSKPLLDDIVSKAKKFK